MIKIINALDFCIVYFLLYRSLIWLQNTRAFNLIKGLIFLSTLFFISTFLKFSTLNWILGHLTTVFLVMIIIIFQPELRRFLERVGASNSLFSPFLLQDENQDTLLIKNMLTAIEKLSNEKIGALIVIEASTNLESYCQSGIPINGDLNDELIHTLFFPATPTHDGALIIRKDKIVAAGCMLPLTQAPLQDRRLGMRHRAALGLSDVSDAVIIVVSEEEGVISLVENGNIHRFMSKESLSSRLFNLYQNPGKQSLTFKDIISKLSFFSKKETHD